MAQWTLTAKAHLRNYQWKAIKFAMREPRNALFLDMGLGKTTITLHAIKAMKHSGELGGLPVLVVAPIRVLHNVWRQEAEKWQHTHGLRFSIMHGNERQRIAAFNADVDVMLINRENLVWLNTLLGANGYGTSWLDYDTERIRTENNRRLRWMPWKDSKADEWRALRNNPAAWREFTDAAAKDPKRLLEYADSKEVVPELKRLPERAWPFSMLVIDESSQFKHSSTQSWKTVRAWAPLFKRVTLLTGTPTPNTMLELWPQIYLLDEGTRLGRSVSIYRDRYFYKADYNGYDYRLRRGADQRINDSVKDIVMRLDAKDWLDVPEVLHNVVDVVLPDDKLEQYKQFEEQMFLELITSSVEAISAASLSMRCHQFANGAMYAKDNKTDTRVWEPVHDAKLEALEEIVRETGSNVMIAYQFKHDLERLKQNYPAAPVLGSGVGTAETKRIIDDWNAQKIPVLLVHPQSAGHGLNLQHGGHTIIFFSLTWSLEQHDQLIARLHRSGQTERVVVHYLRTKDTIDELIYTVLQTKARSQTELLNALRDYSMQRENLRSTRREARDAEAEVQRIEGGQR
jgi:SNF2 family DNA or RNA helicase